ncbi:MAG: nitroreductase [Deltaproteobacteria bacterium]|nr:MAG: nitroreductase [Deltaproteobacteria bacterium]
MDVVKLIQGNRSYRRFDAAEKIGMQELEEMVSMTRYCASAANRQPLKYILCADEQVNSKVFACLSWAGYLSDWEGPEPHERPAGYIVITGDSAIADNFYCDHGIAAQTILLAAREKGFGGCMIAAVNHARLRSALTIPENLKILLVVALGRPVEEVVVDDLDVDGNIRYWRDEQGVHHVPKRTMSELVAGRFG